MSAQFITSRADTDTTREFEDESEFERVRSLLDEAGVDYEVGAEDDGQDVSDDLPVDIVEHRDGESTNRSDDEPSGPSPISTGLSPARFVAHCPVCDGISGQVYRCEHCEADLTESGTTIDMRGGA